MLPPVLPLFRIRRERHTAFALRSNSPDFEMTSLICSRGGIAAAAAVAVDAHAGWRTDRRGGRSTPAAALSEGMSMIGMVLVTHGRLAAEFVAALEHVVGPQSQVAAVCIGPEDDMEQRRQDILQSIREVDSGDGAVLLTDMFGGTPSNLAISVMDRGKVEVIAGVNLPMLIKLASLRQSESLERTVLGAQEAGRKYINVASQILADARR